VQVTSRRGRDGARSLVRPRETKNGCLGVLDDLRPLFARPWLLLVWIACLVPLVIVTPESLKTFVVFAIGVSSLGLIFRSNLRREREGEAQLGPTLQSGEAAGPDRRLRVRAFLRRLEDSGRVRWVQGRLISKGSQVIWRSVWRPWAANFARIAELEVPTGGRIAATRQSGRQDFPVQPEAATVATYEVSGQTWEFAVRYNHLTRLAQVLKSSP